MRSVNECCAIYATSLGVPDSAHKHIIIMIQHLRRFGATSHFFYFKLVDSADR